MYEIIMSGIIIEGDFCAGAYTPVFEQVLNGMFELGVLALSFIGNCISKNQIHTAYCSKCFNKTKNRVPGKYIKEFMEKHKQRIIKRPSFEHEVCMLATLLKTRERNKPVEWPLILKDYFNVVPDLFFILKLEIKKRDTMRVSDYFTYIISGVVNKELAFKKFLDVQSDEDQMRLEDVLWYNNFIFKRPCVKKSTHEYSMYTIQKQIFETVYGGLYRLNIPHELIIIIWQFV